MLPFKATGHPFLWGQVYKLFWDFYTKSCPPSSAQGMCVTLGLGAGPAQPAMSSPAEREPAYRDQDTKIPASVLQPTLGHRVCGEAFEHLFTHLPSKGIGLRGL